MGLEKGTLDQLRIDRTDAQGKRRFSWIWLLVVLVLLFCFGAWWWRSRLSLPQVQTLVVRESPGGPASVLLNASGYVVARREATVSSKVTGKVVEVLVEEGMKVKEGQILARLDDSNVKTSLDLAEAQLASSRTALQETRVRLEAADRELRRVSGLATNRVSSEADLDRATADANSLRAHLAQQEAEVAVAQKQVAYWRQQMDDNLIRAPFSGIVVSKNAQPGEMISPISAGGGFTRTGICTIVDMASLEIEIDVNESYINRVQPALPVEATLDAYPDWKIPCQVKAIIPTADRQKATVKVRVSFESLDPRILPEMGVKVAFRSGAEAGSPRAAVTVPKAAVREQDGRTVVYVVQNGRAERRAVRVEAAEGDQVAVLAGLAAGDKVIVNAPQNLKDGAAVEEKHR